MPNLYLKRHTSSAKLPTMGTDFSACYDLYANIQNRLITYHPEGRRPVQERCETFFHLFPGERALIPTGFYMCTDPGWKIEIAPRSGNAINMGLSLINCIGIVDSDYRHEAMILVINHGSDMINIKDEMRIAQLSVEKVNKINILLCEDLPDSNSNRDGGLGSTDE